MAALVDNPPADFAATYSDAASALGLPVSGGASYSAARATTTGATASAAVTSHLRVPAYGTLDLRGTLRLRKVAGMWRVEWSPTAIADQLGPGDHFAVTRTWPARAPVLGAAGASLTPAGVSVGVVGQRVSDPAQVGALLTGAGFPAPAVAAALRAAAAHPTQLQPVGVIPLTTYQALRAAPGTTLYSIGGTTFTQGASAPLTTELGAHLVGTIGPVTADGLRVLGPLYTPAALVGRNGIESAYERQLAGSPAVAVTVADAKGSTLSTLGTVAGSAGTPVTTSIDPAVQSAAESAMAGVDPTAQAAMVVLRASTGEMLASVSRPPGAGFDVALDGAVPPGSTFKIITTTALLDHGATATTATTCPKTLAVNGQTFRNFEGEAAANLTLQQAFAQSCNTAFIQLAAGLPDGQSLVQAAGLFGLGTTPRLGLPVAGTSVPTPADANQRAGTAIGQSAIVVSPLAMASVAATVDSGAHHAPRLVAGAPDDALTPQPLPAGVADTLRSLMASVVASGTAAGAGLPAGTAGKTGTPEFGPGPNPKTHAWFVGYRGDLAFAVFVYGGGTGGSVAAPLAAKMLRALPAGYGP